MNKHAKFGVWGLILFFLMAGLVIAQENEVVAPAVQNAEDQSANDEDMLKDNDEMSYSYGSVVSTAADKIVLSEYDYESDQDVEVSYQVAAETTVENVKAITDLVKGDNVEIFFKEVDGAKKAQVITKEIEEDLGEENIDDTSNGEDNASAVEENADVTQVAPVVETQSNMAK